MPGPYRFQLSPKKQRIAINFYLSLIAFYSFISAVYLVNVLIKLTVKNSFGTYFELISAPIDRSLIYLLGFMSMLYITIKLRRRIIPLLLLFVCTFASYLVSMQIVDTFIILANFTALTWWLTSSKPFMIMNRRETISLFIVYLTLTLIIIEFLSLVCWFIFPLSPQLSQEGICRHVVDLETKMFLLTGCLAPLLAVIFLFLWIAKFLSHCSLSKRFFTFFTQNFSRLNNHHKKPIVSSLLIYSMILSFLVTFYPYSPGLNTDMHPIGVDIPLYKNWLEKLGNVNLFDAFIMSFSEYPDRSLSLFIIYFVKYISGLPALTVVQFLPIILGPALVLSVYIFAQKTIGANNVSSFTAFLAVSSFHVSIGMYAGFLSNWMALIELYLFASFFFGFLKEKSYRELIAASFLSFSLLFTHSWTWEMTMGVLIIYLLFSLIRRKSRKNFSLEIQALSAIILISVLAGLVRNYALGRLAGGFEALKLAQKMVSVSSLASFWEDTFYLFLHTMYGFFVNPLAFLLAVLGGFTIILDDRPVNRYLTSWLIFSSLFFVLTSGWSVKSRILFNMPLPIFESLGLVVTGNIIQKFFGFNKGVLIKNLVTLLILLISLNYAFRCSFAMSQLTYNLF